MAREKHLTLINTGFCVKNRQYSYADVERIYYQYVQAQKTMNFVAAGVDHSVVVKLYIKNMTNPLVITTGPQFGSFMGFNFGESASERLIGKLAEIQRQTFRQRVDKYMDALQTSGYFYYDGKKVTSEGDIHYPNKVLNLKGAIPIFRGPFYVCHEIKGGSFFGRPKRYYIETTIDADVFFLLLDKVFGIRFART